MTKLDCIIFFGSTSRAEADKISDRDVLLIENDLNMRKFIAEKFIRAGFDIRSYSRKRFLNLSYRNPLFVRHLLREGKFYGLNSKYYRASISGEVSDAFLKKSSDWSVNLCEVAFNTPDSMVGRFWMMDVFYVAVRNFGIVQTHQEGYGSFSYRDCMNFLKHRYGLTYEERDALLYLRIAKNRYRSNNISHFDDTDYIRNTLDKVFGEGFSGSIGGENYQKEFKKGRGYYINMRAIEKQLLSYAGHGSEALDNGRHKWLRSALIKPAEYGFLFQDCHISGGV